MSGATRRLSRLHLFPIQVHFFFHRRRPTFFTFDSPSLHLRGASKNYCLLRSSPLIPSPPVFILLSCLDTHNNHHNGSHTAGCVEKSSHRGGHCAPPGTTPINSFGNLSESNFCARRPSASTRKPSRTFHPPITLAITPARTLHSRSIASVTPSR